MDDSHFSNPEGVRDEVLDADEAASQQEGFAEGEWPSRDAAEYEPSEPADYPWGPLQADSPPPSVHAPLLCRRTVTPP